LVSRKTERLLLAGFLGVVFLYCMVPVHNGNIFWHLRNGEDILDTGRIRLEDPFTHTMRGGYWVQQEWLAEVAFAGAWRIGGAAGLILLKGVVVTASVLLAALAARRRGASAASITLIALLWLAVTNARWIARPHVFTMFFFGLYLFLLSGKGKRSLPRSLLLFLPLQVLWVNTHAGFVMGPFLLCLPALDQLTGGTGKGALKALILPLCAVLVSGVHPNGFRSLEYLPAFLSQPLFRESIREWWSPFDPRYQPGVPLSRTAVLLVSAMVATAAVLLTSRRRIRLSSLTGLILLGTASIFAARNIELLSLAVIAWVPHLLRFRTRAWIPAVLLSAAVAVAFIHGVPREVGPPKRLGIRVDWRIYPVELSDFIDENPALLSSTVFNTNEISGYLEYRFGESLPLYMDGRCLLYPERFYEEYLLLAEADSTRSLEQLRVIQDRGIDLALFDWQDPGTSAAWILSRLPGWAPVFWDDLTIAYAGKDMLDSAGLGELAMDYVDPLDAAALLTWPLYRIPPVWIPELERAAAPPQRLGAAGVLLCAARLREGDLAGAADAVTCIADDSLRTSLEAVLHGRMPPGSVPVHLEVLRTWSLVRSGDTDSAMAVVRRTGDPVLREALEIWSSWQLYREVPQGLGYSLPFLPVNMLEAAGDSATGSETSRLVLASAALTVGLLDSAVVVVEELLADTDSLSPWMMGTAALVLAASGDDSGAVELADLALSLSRNPATVEARGRIDWMQGRYEAAAVHFRWLLDVSPGYPVARSLYADCLWRLGEVDGAAEQYRLLRESGSAIPPEASGRIAAMEMLTGAGRR
jgi:hypothetical protein